MQNVVPSPPTVGVYVGLLQASYAVAAIPTVPLNNGSVRVAVGVGVIDGVLVILGVNDGVAVILGVAVTLGVNDGVAVNDGVEVILGVVDGVVVTLGVVVGEIGRAHV